MTPRVLPGALVLAVLGPAASAQFTGLTSGGELVAIYADGEGNTIAPTGFTPLTALTRLPDGTLVGATKGPFEPKLIALDPSTGAGSLLHYSFLNNVTALATSPAGGLFAIDAKAGGIKNDLYRLDLSVAVGCTCIKTFLGEVNVGGITAMAFAPGGTLYAWSTIQGLITIDPATAIATDVNGTADGSAEIQSLTFDSKGALWGINDALYTVHVGTGAKTLVGNGSYGAVSGLEADPASFPFLTITPSLSPGQDITVDLAAPAGEVHVLGLALDPGPLCLTTLPFCLALGPTATSVIFVSVGPVPPGGVQLVLPTPADPVLSSVALYWQAVSIKPPAEPRKSNPASTTFL